jgi:hypothetical protein
MEIVGRRWKDGCYLDVLTWARYHRYASNFEK